MVRSIFLYGLCLSLLLLNNCPSPLSVESESQLGESPSAGTNVGNPVSELTASFKLDDVSNDEPRCAAVESSSDASETRFECAFAPDSLGFGVMGTYGLSCDKPDCSEVLTQLKTDPAAAIQLPLYDGELVPVEITAQENPFPKPFMDIVAGKFKSIVGLHWILAYLDFVLPDTEIVAEHLRGMNCRICLIDKEALEDSSIVSEICGDAEASRGTLWCDVDGDGVRGFIDPEKVTATSIEVSPTLPENYLTYSKSDLKRMLGSFLQENLVATGLMEDGDFPYTSFVVPLAEAATLQPGRNYNFLLSIYPENSLRFSNKHTAITDADPIYNLIDDGLLQFELAAPLLTVEEKELSQ